MSDLTGRSFGNYVLQAKVGEGGMGAVYVAEHKRFGRKVAVKTLHPQLSQNAEMVSRFFTEARSANEIRNQHIIEILDFDELEDGTCYIVMEWLEGHSLGQLLASEGRLPVERALHIADGICSALGAAHARKIIHRDLKPDNVFLEERNGDPDFVKVLDFGIAKLLDEEAQTKKGFATRTGAIIGTPAYMSPEQCRGAHKEIDHRSDIYSAGAMVYQMVTGKRPFAGEGLGELLMAHLTQEPEPPSKHFADIPPHVDKAILRALGKRREDRFESMEDFAAALSGIEVPIGGTLVQTRTGKSGLYKIIPGTGTGTGTGTTTGNRTPSRPDADPTVMGDGELPPPAHKAQAASASAKADAGKAEPKAALQNSTFSSVASELVSIDQRPRRRGNSAVVIGGALLAVVAVGGGFAALHKPAPAEVAPVVANADPTPAPTPAPAPAPAAAVAAPAAGVAPPSAAVPAAAPAPTAPVAAPAPTAPAAAVNAAAPAANKNSAPAAAAAGPRELPKLNVPVEGGDPAPAPAAPVAAPTPAPAAPPPAAPAAKIDRGPALDKALDGRQDALTRCVELKGPGLKKVSVEAMVTVDAEGAVKDVDVTAKSADGELSDELRACLEKALKKGSYPKGSTTDVAEGKWTLSVE